MDQQYQQPLNGTVDESKLSRSEKRLNKKLNKHRGAIDAFNLDKERFSNGLVRNRKPTDMFWCIIFVVFIVAMFGISGYCLTQGDIDKLIAPQDADRNFCGFGEAKGLPNVYWTLSLTQSKWDNSSQAIYHSAVCVKECPKTKGQAIECHSTRDVADCNSKSVQNIVYPTLDILNMCIPEDVEDLPSQYKEAWENSINKLNAGASGRFFADMERVWKEMLICFFLAMIYSIMFMWMMATFPTLIAYVAIVFMELIFFGGAGFLFYSSTKDNISHDARTANLASAGVLILFGLIFNCAMWCWWTSLKVAIAIVDATADFFLATKRLVFVSLGMFVVQLAWGAICFSAVICVAANQQVDPKLDSESLQGKEVTWDKQSLTFIGLITFGFLWIQIYLKNQTIFCAMASASTYYFNSNAEKEGSAEVVKALMWGNFVHCGSIAFGSLIMALVTMLNIAADQAQENSDNAAAKCAQCCAGCLRDLVEYINTVAYANMAVCGDSFCSSAWNGFILELKHLIKFYFAKNFAGMFVFLGFIFILGMNCLSLYLISKYGFKSWDQLSYHWVPFVIVCIGSLITGGIFLGLFDEAVCATLQCMAVDRDINDGDTKFGPPTYHKKLRAIYGEGYGKQVGDDQGQNQVNTGQGYQEERRNSLR